jgi:hypothetical protein
MTHQVALTIRAKVKPGETEDLKDLLSIVGADIERNEILPFARLSNVHFARFVILDGGEKDPNQSIQPSLVFASNVDAPLGDHLTEWVRDFGEGLDQVYSHCEGYPGPDQRTPSSRLDYLQAHMVPSQAFYVNTIGRTVEQIHQEAQLRDILEGFLDRQQAEYDWSGWDARRVHAAIQDFIRGQPDLRWAERPAEGLTFGWRLKERIRFFLILLVLLVLAPVSLLVLPIWLILLRYHEKRDAAQERHLRLSHQTRKTLALDEDRLVQNQFSAVGNVKPGWFRVLTVRALLWALNISFRHIFNRGILAGVDTIHFAQWIMIDGGQRILFLSNYDGSLESYMDDFINKVAWGLNAVFSNGVGYPKTNWLVLEGANDEQAFKAFLRKHQIPTQAWYTAYGWLTARNIDNNAKLRAGLYGEKEEQDAARWLQRL